MIRTQIYLTEDEHQGVTRLAKASGKKQSEAKEFRPIKKIPDGHG